MSGANPKPGLLGLLAGYHLTIYETTSQNSDQLLTYYWIMKEAITPKESHGKDVQSKDDEVRETLTSTPCVCVIV